MNWKKKASMHFWNCQATYICFMFENIGSKLGLERFLLLLSQYELHTKKILLSNQILEQGAWKYQPISWVSNQGTTFAINYEFGEQIKKYFDVDYEEIELSTDIIVAIEKFNSQNECLIISIDEYYNKDNSKYYLTKHNKHNLLIQETNKSRKMVIAFDSETLKSNMIPYEDIKTMFNHSIYDKKIINLNFASYNNKTRFEDDFKPYYCNAVNNSFVNEFFRMLTNDLSDANVSLFALEGYRYAVIFKIIPYIRMRSIFFHECFKNYCSVDIAATEELWRKLNYNLFIQEQKKKVDLDKIRKCAETIISYEYELNSYVSESW
jgi:hypothetical protein